MNVGELIKELSKYPMDMKISNVNSVSKNMLGCLSLLHKDTPEEAEARIKRQNEWNREHQERMDRAGEVTSFANRW